MKNNLELVVMENIKGFGQEVNKHLKKLNKTDENFISLLGASRFSNGEGKVKLDGSVRDKDLYILSDVGNYQTNYEMHGQTHYMSPDEHFQDIKRVISATGGHAKKISVIMPLLYQSRQHKRKGNESLDCAIALQELERLGVKEIITFDAHDPSVSNAIPNLPLDNFYPTNIILESIIEKDPKFLDNLLVISPDMGAMERARYYAEMLGCDVGVFYKRRDLTKVVNGKNQIVEHIYMGPDVKDKNVIVVDDMISSGQSMIDVSKEIKEKGANKVYLTATFALLTEGIDGFCEAYKERYFDKIYTTNLSYVPEEYKKEEWYEEVDCSLYLSKIINNLNKGKSLMEFFNGKEKILEKINKIKE
jgi:ribose-phosphate pyrophosphokinase